MSKAKAIEKESWQTTDRLTEDLFDELDSLEGEDRLTDTKEVEKKETSIESETLDIAREGLIYIARGDNAGFARLAEECYMLDETLAQCVNELCYEILGDVGVQEKNGTYVLIADYEQEIKEWLKL